MDPLMILSLLILGLAAQALVWVILIATDKRRREQKEPKIERNVTWLHRVPRRSPCERVYAGDMLSTLKGQSSSSLSDLAHRPISLN